MSTKFFPRGTTDSGASLSVGNWRVLRHTPVLKRQQIMETHGVRCLGCGSTNVVEGLMMDSNGSPVCFQLADHPTWKRILGVGQREVATFACVRCGLAQQRVNFTRRDREQLIKFEGPQPSIVDAEP
jgi:hypothetical protein